MKNTNFISLFFVFVGINASAMNPTTVLNIVKRTYDTYRGVQSLSSAINSLHYNTLLKIFRHLRILNLSAIRVMFGKM